MHTGLADCVVIVTGATSNIGRGIALAFAAEGVRLVVVGRDHDAGRLVAQRAVERGAAEVLWRATDVTDAADVGALVAEVVALFGGVDVLVNGVGGTADVGEFATSSPAHWQADIEANLGTVLTCTHAVLPLLMAQNSGRIINIGSTAGLVGDRLMAVYSAAKGAVHAFTRVLALEVGGSGVTVNAIAPYRTRSDDPADAAEGVSAGSRYHPENGIFTRLRAEKPEVIGSVLRETALPRDHAWPEEVGAAAVFLASTSAAFITGQIVQVDGGVTLV